METLFKHFDTLAWECDVKLDTIEKIAFEKFSNISKQCSCNKKIIRLIGQSGSGKTTQLLPTAKAKFKQAKQEPLHLCVREFASLHPRYKEIVEENGKEQAREKTNGFALRTLVFCLFWAIEKGIDILLEMTFLTVFFENMFQKWLKRRKYSAIFLCVAVNIEISNQFIQKRLASKNSQESGRVVLKRSIDFFDKQLTQGLQLLQQGNSKQRIVIWNVFDQDCKFDGWVGKCLPIFLQEREKIGCTLTDERRLLQAKIYYFCYKSGS